MYPGAFSDRDSDGRPQEDPVTVHCFFVKREYTVGDLLGTIISMECDFFFVCPVHLS